MRYNLVSCGILSALAAVLAGCGSSPDVGAIDVSGEAVELAKAAKVDICHHEGNGSSHMINVSQRAYDAHVRLHGDHAPMWLYPDMDGDGFGDEAGAVWTCDEEGYTDEDGDCDDTDAEVNPDAWDGCNGIDDDCDGLVDDNALDDKMLISVDSRADVIYEIDPETAAVYPVSQVWGLPDARIHSVAADGVVVGTCLESHSLMDIDVCSGEIGLVGPTQHGHLCGISFGPDDMLYGIDAEDDRLVTIDPYTAEVSHVGPLGLYLHNCGLAYDCAADRLLAVDHDTGSVFTVDEQTGEAEILFYSGVPFDSVGLEFDPVGNRLIAATGYELWSIDLATESSSFIGDLDAHVDDLVFADTCE